VDNASEPFVLDKGGKKSVEEVSSQSRNSSAVQSSCAIEVVVGMRTLIKK